MTARAFLGLESLTTDGHGWTRIIDPLPVLIRVHPRLIHLNYGSAALSVLHRGHDIPTGPRLCPKYLFSVSAGAGRAGRSATFTSLQRGTDTDNAEKPPDRRLRRVKRPEGRAPSRLSSDQRLE